MKLKPLLIALPDYERIFRVVHSVTEASGRTPHKACILMSACGAYLLNKAYGIKAHVVAGVAIYGMDERRELGTVIGTMRDGKPYSDRENFHMWVETETHAVDFQAPLFREMLADQSLGQAVPRKMFQRALSEQCDGNFSAPGDFDLFPNPELTSALTEDFFASAEGADLMLFCENWFTKPPRKIRETVGMMDSLEGPKVIQLSPITLTGAWGR